MAAIAVTKISGITRIVRTPRCRNNISTIIVNAPPKTMRSLMGIVDKLDIRRDQVRFNAAEKTEVVAVMQDGELVWSHYYGDQSPGTKADANTRFNVASITKLIAAEAARPSKGTEVINASNPSAALVVAGQDVESTS